MSAEAFDDIFGDRWKLKNFYILRSVERGRQVSLDVAVFQIQELLNVYNLSINDPYSRALRYTQEQFIGPYDRDPVSISTVGEVLAGEPST